MRMVATFVVATALARAACVAVPSGNILARDISGAVPLFQSLDPDVFIGFAPFPGTERVLSAHDLLLTARRNGLAFPPAEQVPSVCIVRVVRRLSVEDVSAALLLALDIVGVRLEVLDFSNQPLPPGRLLFQLDALNRPPGNDPRRPVIWRGKLIYDDQHSLTVWAKVRVSVEREVFLAKATIPKGAVIRAEQITTACLPQFPMHESAPRLPLVIAGKVARRMLPAGQPIVAEELGDLQDVLRGETVHVEAMEGGASIRFDATAQSSGQKGEIILVYNRSSGRSFRALIDGREQVVVRGTL